MAIMLPTRTIGIKTAPLAIKIKDTNTMIAHQIDEHPCARCVHFSQSVWRPVRPGAVSMLARAFVRREIAEGEVLFDQGSQNKGIFCVSRGLFAVRALHKNGASTLLRLAYPGDLVGFRSFMRNQRHQTEARALMASRVCTVASREAEKLIEGTPLVMSRLASRCIDEIDSGQDRFISTAISSNRQRLMQLLLRLVEVHGDRSSDQAQARLPLSRSDMADMLGVQPETMSRLFKRLQQDQLIFISGRMVTIPSVTALSKAAGGGR